MKRILLSVILVFVTVAGGTEIPVGTSKVKVEATGLTPKQAELVLAKLYGGLYFVSDAHHRYIATYFPRAQGEAGSFIFAVMPASVSLRHREDARRVYLSWGHTAASSRCYLDVSYIELDSPTEKIQIESASVIVACP